MREGLENFVEKLEWAYLTYGLDVHKLFMLDICNTRWNAGNKIQVTELIKHYNGTSPATTHRSIHALVKQKLLKLVVDKNDKRIKYLAEGSNLSKLNSVLGGK